MRVPLHLPDLDLPGVQATVCSWHCAAGQRVVEGDRLVEVLAGDVTIDLAAPATGTLVERSAAVDQPVKAGDLLAVIEAD